MSGIRSTFLIAALTASALHAATVDTADASAVFERYIAARPSSQTGNVVVEVKASLPRLGKLGRLLAIRHRNGYGKTEYQVLQADGDPTVKQQVIARYLAAELQSENTGTSAVAFTPANYAFRYVGPVPSAGTTEAAGSKMYVFQITPRKKRAGLIKGSLWIDAATGIAVHEDGRTVKSPSIFVRRINVIRDVDLRGGAPYSRTTHLAVDTRLVGPAELTITERPCSVLDNHSQRNSSDELVCSVDE